MSNEFRQQVLMTNTMKRSLLSIFAFISLSIFYDHYNFIFAQIHSDSTSHLIDVINRFEAFFIETLEEEEAPGAAVAIVKDDKIVYLNSFGVREIGRQEKVDIHTVFRLASVSKGFASVLTGLLVEEGILKWQDRVIKYVPNFSLKNLYSTRNLTIRHILSHTSGLPQHTYTDLLEENMPFDEILKKLNKVSLIGPVGRYYSYQNVLYSLISNIIKAATGRTYKELLTERIFEPLDMDDASLGRESFVASPNHAMPHVRRSFELMVTEVKPSFYKVLPSAGVNASILDMARWLRAMMGGVPEIISPDIIQNLTIPLIKTPPEMRKYRWRDRLRDAHYGLGWRIYDYAGTRIIYHGGWVEGFRAEIGFIPEQKIGIVVLLNCESMVANLLLPTFFDMYLSLHEVDSTQVNN